LGRHFSASHHGRAKDKTMSGQEEFDTETETEAEQDIILTAEDLRKLSPLDWARYGTNRIAYMRPVMVNNQRAIAIHAADGTQIGAAPDYALGAAAIFQHGMGVALVH
jgi:hypothetical protein